MCDKLKSKFDCFLNYIQNISSKNIKEETSKSNCIVDNYNCPCCNYPTLPERGAYYICPLCHWEDDGQDYTDEDETWCGPNGDYTLKEAKENFLNNLTMYRVNDIENFLISSQKISLKEKLIDIFNRIKVIPKGHICDKTKEEIIQITNKLNS